MSERRHYDAQSATVEALLAHSTAEAVQGIVSTVHIAQCLLRQCCNGTTRADSSIASLLAASMYLFVNIQSLLGVVLIVTRLDLVLRLFSRFMLCWGTVLQG